MPLITTVTRDGELLPVNWDGDFAVAAMALAACFDVGKFQPDDVYDTDELRFDCYPDAAFPVTRGVAFHLCSYGALANTPLNGGAYTLTRKHKFLDAASRDVLELHPGDVLRAVRH